MNRIIWTERARADVRGLDKPTAMRILVSLHRFADSGEGDVKAGTGLRAGDYRIFFTYPFSDVIEIRRVLHRSEAYR